MTGGRPYAPYTTLLGALVEEHSPSGPTEEHLVEELAGVLWRKKRLRLAEAASYHRALERTTDSSRGTARAALVVTSITSKVEVKAAIKSTPAAAQRELAELKDDEQMTRAAIAAVAAGGTYEAALTHLHESTREAWANQVEWEPGDYGDGETPYTADAASLSRYLETSILPWYAERRGELVAAPVVRAQALGEALDPDKLERLGRYEVHLDRKLERTLSTLIRLQELRRARPAPAEPSAG